MKTLLLLAFALSCASAFGQSYNCVGLDGPAQCPTFMSSFYRTYPVQNSANIFNVASGSSIDLQAKIISAAAACGSTGAIVNVPSGNTYLTSSYYNLPPTNCDATHWVVIQSDHLSSLPPQGTRVNASNRSNMPLLTSTTGVQTNHAVILANDNPTTPLAAAGQACTATGGGASTVPCGYWLAGLDVEVQVDEAFNTNAAIINLGEYCAFGGGGGCPITSGMTINNVSSRFTIDRCYIAGPTDSPTNTGMANGITYTASYLTVRDSTIQHIVTVGQESHGIVSAFTFGPVDIYNNTVEAASINIFFGGTDPIITNSQPSDLYVHQNYLHKVSAWVTSSELSNGYDGKDVLESKNSNRLLAEGNILGPSYDGGQNYVSFQLSPRNSNGGCQWCSANDTIFRYNLSQNVTGWFSVLGVNKSPCEHASDPGCDDVPPCPGSCYFTVGSMSTKRVSVHDNIAENVTGPIIKIHVGLPSVCPSSGNICLLSDINIVHNTVASANQLSPVPLGSGLTTIFFIYSELTGHTPRSDAGYNLTVKDNILPCNDIGSSGCMFNDGGISTSANCTQPTQTCGYANALNAYFIASGAGTTGWVFNGNVIPKVLSAGWAASDIPVQNSDNSAANNFAGSLPAQFADVGFVNWNSGTGGDYHLCITSTVPVGCTTESNYQDLATDSFNDATKEGPSPGANVDAVNQMTANVTTGLYTIQPFRSYGKVKGEHQELRYWLKFPGYYDAGISDGSGKTDFSGYNGGGQSEGWSGINIFHDLQHDPGGLINLSGTNVGLTDYDYITSTSNCGLGHLADSKAFWGQVSLVSVNNVRAIFGYTGPFIDETNSWLPATSYSNLDWRYLWTLYRPGFVAQRYSVDNNCGSTITFSSFNPRMSTSTYTFNHIPSASQYPPSYGQGWQDPVWQTAHCGVAGGIYDLGEVMPWGYLSGTGWNMHSITSTSSSSTWHAGIGPGYTTKTCGNPSDANHYPITGEFLNIQYTDASLSGGSAYNVAFAGGGARSELGNQSASIAASGTDAMVKRTCGWYGDLAIRNSTNAGELAGECQTPVVPTMNAGTSPSFNHDYGMWDMTADATPKVDFTLNHQWTSPIFAIHSWNGGAPTVTINGVVQTANVNYVWSTNDGSGDPVSNSSAGLLVQIVGLPTNGSGGSVALANATHIIITAGSAPTGFGVMHVGTTYQRGKTIIH